MMLDSVRFTSFITIHSLIRPFILCCFMQLQYCYAENDTLECSSAAGYCNQLYEPVCASNRKTYMNICYLQKYTCNRRTGVNVKGLYAEYSGECNYVQSFIYINAVFSPPGEAIFIQCGYRNREASEYIFYLNGIEFERHTFPHDYVLREASEDIEGEWTCQAKDSNGVLGGPSDPVKFTLKPDARNILTTIASSSRFPRPYDNVEFECNVIQEHNYTLLGYVFFRDEKQVGMSRNAKFTKHIIFEDEGVWSCAAFLKEGSSRFITKSSPSLPVLINMNEEQEIVLLTFLSIQPTHVTPGESVLITCASTADADRYEFFNNGRSIFSDSPNLFMSSANLAMHGQWRCRPEGTTRNSSLAVLLVHYELNAVLLLQPAVSWGDIYVQITCLTTGGEGESYIFKRENSVLIEGDENTVMAEAKEGTYSCLVKDKYSSRTVQSTFGIHSKLGIITEPSTSAHLQLSLSRATEGQLIECKCIFKEPANANQRYNSYIYVNGNLLDVISEPKIILAVTKIMHEGSWSCIIKSETGSWSRESNSQILLIGNELLSDKPTLISSRITGRMGDSLKLACLSGLRGKSFRYEKDFQDITHSLDENNSFNVASSADGLYTCAVDLEDGSSLMSSPVFFRVHWDRHKKPILLASRFRAGLYDVIYLTCLTSEPRNNRDRICFYRNETEILTDTDTYTLTDALHWTGQWACAIRDHEFGQRNSPDSEKINLVSVNDLAITQIPEMSMSATTATVNEEISINCTFQSSLERYVFLRNGYVMQDSDSNLMTFSVGTNGEGMWTCLGISGSVTTGLSPALYLNVVPGENGSQTISEPVSFISSSASKVTSGNNVYVSCSLIGQSSGHFNSYKFFIKRDGASPLRFESDARVLRINAEPQHSGTWYCLAYDRSTGHEAISFNNIEIGVDISQ